MRYDAFISYRHGGLDGQVAERLHRLLETFRIPRPIAKKVGKKSLTRIFRDKEELPTSADLSSNIQQALEESEYLLLVCSARTKESRWVMQEVDSFIALRGHARVITLLIDGEPEDAFPEQLRFREVDGQRVEVEPLAADIRAGSAKESLKKLKNEVTRIMAPLLGVRYDDLRQRHRERRLKRMLAAGAAALVLVAAFGAYALSQYLRIQQQMQLKLESQSYVLAEYAAGALRQGDVPTAALLALEGLPENLAAPERPYVPAAELALADALGAYNYADGFTWHRAVELERGLSEVFISPDETLVAVGDDAGGTVVIDADTGRQLGQVEGRWWGNSRYFGFLASGALLQLTEDGLLAMDARTLELLWQLPPAELLAISPNGQFFATATNADEQTTLRLYSGDGTLLNTTVLKEHRMYASGFGEADYNCFELSDDGAHAAVLTTAGDLLLVQPGAQPVVLAREVYQAVCLFNGDMLACTLAGANTDDGWEQQNELQLLDLAQGQTLLRQPVAAVPPMAFLPGGDFSYAADARIIRWDAAIGAESVLAAFDSTVISYSVCGDTLLAGCASGSYAFTSLSSGVTSVFSSDYPCRLTALGQRLALCADSLSGSIRLLRQNTRTPPAATTGMAGYGAVRTSGDGSRALACVAGAVHLIDLDTGAPLATFQTNADYYYGDLALFSAEAGNIVISGNGVLEIYDPAGQTRLYRLETYHDIYGNTAQWREGDTLMVLDFDAAAVVEEIALPPDTVAARVLGGALLLEAPDAGSRVVNRRTGDTYALGDSIVLAHWQQGDNLLLCTRHLDDDSLTVHDTRTGRVVYTLSADSSVTGAWFADDGRTLVLAQGVGRATAYTLATGAPLADLGQAGALLTGITPLPGGGVLSGYQTAGDEETFALLRQTGTLAPLARVERFVALAGPQALLIHSPDGDALSRIPLYTTAQLVQMAEDLLDGQTLTAAQREKYHIQDA